MAIGAHRRNSAGGRLTHHSIKASRRARPITRIPIAAAIETTPTMRTTSGARHSGATARNTRPSTTRTATANQNRPGLCHCWITVIKLRGLARPITPIRPMTTPNTGHENGHRYWSVGTRPLSSSNTEGFRPISLSFVYPVSFASWLRPSRLVASGSYLCPSDHLCLPLHVSLVAGARDGESPGLVDGPVM